MIQKQSVHKGEKITKIAAALCLSLLLFIGIAAFSALTVSATTSGLVTWRITADSADTILRVDNVSVDADLWLDAGSVTIVSDDRYTEQFEETGVSVKLPVKIAYNSITGTGGFIPMAALAMSSEFTLSDNAFIEFDDEPRELPDVPVLGKIQDGDVRFGGGEIRLSGGITSGFTHYEVLAGANVTVNGTANFVIDGSISVNENATLRLMAGINVDGNLRGRAAAYVECDGELYIAAGSSGSYSYDSGHFNTMIAYDAELRGRGKIYLTGTGRFMLGSGASLKLGEGSLLDIGSDIVVGLMSGYYSIPVNVSVNADISGTIHVQNGGVLQLTPYSGSINTYGFVLRSTGKIIGDAGALIEIIPSSTSRIKTEEGSLIDMSAATAGDKSVFLMMSEFDVSEYLTDNSGSLSSYDDAVKSIILWGTIKLNENVLAVFDIPAATFGNTAELIGVGEENIVAEDIADLLPRIEGNNGSADASLEFNVRFPLGSRGSVFSSISLSDKPMVVRFGTDDTKARELLKSILTEITGDGYKTSDIKVGGGLLVLPSEEGEDGEMLRYVAELSHFSEDGYGSRTTPYYTRPDAPTIDGAAVNNGATVNLTPHGTFPRREFAVLSESDILNEIESLSESEVQDIIEAYVAEQLKNGNGQDISSLFAGLTLPQFKTYIGNMSKSWIMTTLLSAVAEYSAEQQLIIEVQNYVNSNTRVYINGGQQYWNDLDTDAQTDYINATLRPSLFNAAKANFTASNEPLDESDLREAVLTSAGDWSDAGLEYALAHMGETDWRGVLSQLTTAQIIELTGESPLQALSGAVAELDNETMANAIAGISATDLQALSAQAPGEWIKDVLVARIVPLLMPSQPDDWSNAIAAMNSLSESDLRTNVSGLPPFIFAAVIADVPNSDLLTLKDYLTENQLMSIAFSTNALPADLFTSYIGNETDIPQWTSNPRFTNLAANTQYYFISRVPGDLA
ncbi:hypothetical protein FACS1894133_2370 [Clostridia bacterium]|nr:hypothetical protein FACS1894133_2370 [Clostridia bacterium]